MCLCRHRYTGTVTEEGLRTKRFRLTPDGERQLAAEFGPLPNASWPELRDRVLAPRCAAPQGPNVAAELKSFPALRIALALEAVGLDYRPRTTATVALNRIAAKATGAARSDKGAITTALVRRWLVAAPQLTGTGVEAQMPVPFDIETFVRDVLSAATHANGGRWDGAKVFVNHVWRQMTAEGKRSGLNLESFKAHLLEANRQGLLHLSRADLVHAMPPEDVRESEISSFGDVLHFIQT